MLLLPSSMNKTTMSNSASTPNTKTRHISLDKENSTYEKTDWIGSLLVENITIDNDDEIVESTPGTIDICQYLPGGKNHNNIDTTSTKLRFDPVVFPPSESHKLAFESSNPTYIRVRDTLQRAAIQGGYSLVPKSGARFVCKCGRTYANGKGKSSTNREDSGNSRKNGLEYVRRNTSTSLPTDPNETCKFAIKMYHDDKGYFVSTKYGHAIHSNHPSTKSTNDCYRVKLLPSANENAVLNTDNGSVRSILKPMFDELCSLYESKDARHCDMPSIDSVVNVMNDTIHNVKFIFHELDRKKKRRDVAEDNIERRPLKKSRIEEDLFYYHMHYI